MVKPIDVARRTLERLQEQRREYVRAGLKVPAFITAEIKDLEALLMAQANYAERRNWWLYGAGVLVVATAIIYFCF